MNKRIKKLWVKALRSGDYEQGKGRLRRNGSYCCLGVLCDVKAKAGGTQWRVRDGLYKFGSQHLVLPPFVSKWAGVDEGDPWVGDRYLTDLNDNDFDFNYIADRIEKYL